jgi:hypothetical protein
VNKFSPLFIVFSTLVLTGFIFGQGPEYRLSMTEEATKSSINMNTPFNRNNMLLPQSAYDQVTTTNIYGGYGMFMTSVGLAFRSSNSTLPDCKFSIHELVADLNLTDEVSIQAGKKIMKWGTGYAFNPTGVVEPQKTPSDPSDRLNLNDGRNIVAINYLVDKSSLAFVFLNDAEIRTGKLIWDKNEYAFRAYSFISGVDVSLIAHYRQSDRLQTGANCSYVYGDHLEIHGEALAQQGSSLAYHRILWQNQPDTFFTADAYYQPYENAQQIMWKTLAGGQYTFDNGLNVVFEYYYNYEGLSSSEWRKWLNFVKFHDEIQNNQIMMPPNMKIASRINLLEALRTLSPRGTMRNYIFNRWYYSTNNWSSEILAMINANDWSSVLIPTITYRFSENFSLYGRFTKYSGNPDSEYGNLFLKGSLSIGLGAQI